MKKVKVKIKKPYLRSLIILTVKVLCDITNIHLQILTLLYLPSSTLLMRASTRKLLVPYSSLLALCSYKRQPTYFRTQTDINAHVLSSNRFEVKKTSAIEP